MRQVGLFIAAGLYALDNNMNKLANDHANVSAIAERIMTSNRIIVEMSSVQTNILVFNLASQAIDAPTLVDRAKERGLLVFAFGPRTIRLVTHLDVSSEECERAAEILLGVVDQGE